MDVSELKERKKKLKLTTYDLSVLADLPYGTVSKVFTGETKNPGVMTIEKIDQALSKAEQQQRLKAYFDAMRKYFREHPEIEDDQRAFERIYRKEHNLSNDPIPFAVSLTDYPERGNLALQRQTVSLEDFVKMETDRYTQLLDGRLIYCDAPGYKHQLLVEELGDIIKQFISANNGNCKVYRAGFNIQLSKDDNSLLIPDIIVLCQKLETRDFGLLGAPDWVIEVTSPSTRRMDYREKMCKYIQYGVKEYWVVDLQKQIVAVYINDMPMITSLYRFTDDIPVSIYDGKLTICIEKILQGELL